MFTEIGEVKENLYLGKDARSRKFVFITCLDNKETAFRLLSRQDFQ